MNASADPDRLRVVLTFLCGVFFLVLGGHQIYLGVSSEKAPAKPPVKNPTPQPGPVNHATFKLDYQGNTWVLLDQQNKVRLRFPEGLPDPARQPIVLPSDYRQPETLGRAFYQAISALGWPLNSDQYAGLLALEVDGSKLFPDSSQLEKLVSGRVDKVRMEKAREQAKSGNAAEKNHPPSPNGAIPDEYNPKTEAFVGAMKAWAQYVRVPLSRAARKNNWQATYQPPNRKSSVTVNFTDRARGRVLAADFGSQPKDWRIYLQAIFNQHGFKTRVDGDRGPATRECALQFAEQVLNIQGGEYMALLNSR